MKTSLVIGWFALAIVLILMDSLVQNTDTFTDAFAANINSLLNPGSAWGVLGDLVEFLMLFVSLIFLWFPSIWTGNWLWFYWLLVIPICIGFIVSLIMAIRGTASS